MRIFVAGATGVLGVRVVPLLVAAGHAVAGMTRSAEKADGLSRLGAEPVVCDVYDRELVIAAVVVFGPDLVMHQLTDLPDDVTLLPERTGANARMRREGTRNLLAAAQAASAPRFLAQSVAWPLAGDSEAAKAELEESVLAYGGVVLRYGQLYGEGTYYPDSVPPEPRVQVDEAARRTVDVLYARTGIVTILDPA
jgi:nucleoside-diphosphate-sugar epimerase